MDEISLNDDTKHALDQHSKAKVLIPMVDSTSDLTNDPLALDHEKEGNCDESITVKEEIIEPILEIKCDICNFLSENKGSLIEHLETVHDEKIEDDFKCDLCDKHFNRIRDFNYHLKIKHPGCQRVDIKTEDAIEKDIKSFKCDYCDFVTYERPKLKRHINGKHKNGNSFACHICSKSFVVNRGLEFHLAKAHKIGDFKFKCEECGKPFMDKPHLQRHSEIHSKKRKFMCDICSRICETEGFLNLHMKIHEAKELKCDHCEEKFRLLSKLTEHLKEVHQVFEVLPENKSKKCDSCDKEFQNCDKFDNHLKECKTILNSFSCKDCDKIFVSHLSLELHYVTIHEKIMHCCDTCSKAFIHKDVLKRHIKESHSSEPNHVCHLCGQSCIRRTELKRHLFHMHEIGKNKPKCDTCHKTFFSNFELRQHQEQVHIREKKFKCDRCEWVGVSKGKLARHIKEKHIRDEVYPCQYCDYKAYRKGWLTAHLKNKHKNS